MSTTDPTPEPVVRLTTEQAVRLADYTAAVVATGPDEGIDPNDHGPDGLRRRHAAQAPYVELLAELQDELEVTRTVALRIVAEELRACALDLAAYERGALAKVRADEPGWCYEGRTPDESERVTLGEIDRALDDLAIAGQVLALLDGEEA